MTIYNTLVGVVALIDSDSEAGAIRVLESQLTAAGFDVYEGQPGTAFESDDQEETYTGKNRFNPTEERELKQSLVWEDGNTDEPSDQNATSYIDEHAYWSLGPNGGEQQWSVELIVRDESLDEIPDEGVDLGDFPSEAEAKAAAQKYETYEIRRLSQSTPEQAHRGQKEAGMSESKRYCYHADESFVDKDTRQYQVIRVVEGEPGYHVLESHATLDEAVERVASLNQGVGRTPDEVLEIRASSMTANPTLAVPVANPERCIVVVGDPVDGFLFFGPFDNSEDAFNYAEQERLESWWVAPLN